VGGGLGLVGRLGVGVGIDGGEDELIGGGVMVGSHGDLGPGVMAALDHGEQGECALSAACAVCFGPEFALITRRFPEFTQRDDRRGQSNNQNSQLVICG